MVKNKDINCVRPFWQIADDCLMMKTGVYSKVYELELKPVFTQSQDDYDVALNDFTSLFSLLPDFTVIHKMDVFTNKSFKSNVSQEADLLSIGYFKKYLEKPYLDHKSYLIISKTSPNIEKQSSLSSLIFKRNFIPKELISKSDKNDFEKALSRMETVMNQSPSFGIKKLTVEESIELMIKYENLNFEDNNYTSNIYQDATKTKIGNNFISSVCVNSLECLPNKFENVFTDNKYSTEKSSLAFSFLYPIGLSLNMDHIVNQIFIKTSKENIKDQLRKVDSLNRAFLAVDSSNEINLIDSEVYAESLEKGNTPVSYHCNVLLWDSNEKKLEEKVNMTFAAFNKIKVVPNIGFNEILPLYWSCYPGNAADIGYIDQCFLLLDKEASALNIFETNNTNNISEFGLYLNDRINGTPLYVDISDLPIKQGLTNNRNKIVIGPSGSGKSFTTNHFMNSYLRFNTHVVIVDVGDSYKRLCQLHNGKYLQYTENDPVSFNPFYVHKEDLLDSEISKSKLTLKDLIDIEKKESLVTLIFTLWKKNASDATKDEDAIIRDGLNQYFDAMEKSDAFMCFNSYYEYMIITYFPSLENNTLKLINTDSFANVLKMYYKGGEYDYLLNSEENTNLLHENFIVFELDNIKDNPILFPIVTLMIMDTFITKMRLLKNVRKVILIEEAWKAISKDGMAEFMKYLYKTVRKHFGEAWLVTQDLDDILGNEIIKDTIIKNCGAKILLDMREYAANFDQIQTMLSLSNKAKDQILSLNKNPLPGDKYKEVFIGLGNEGQVYGVNLSKEEYATYTTEKAEREKIELMAENYGSLEMAIQMFAEQMN